MTEPITHDLCGGIEYSASYDGSSISDSDVPLAYDPETRTFTAFSSDMTLDGVTKIYVVEADLAAYPGVALTGAESTIMFSVVDPCEGVSL